MNQNDYFDRGLANMRNGNWKQAIEDFTESLRLFPNNSGAYFNRGLSYSNNGDRWRAIADYTESILLNPDYDAAYHNRGVAYKLAGELNDAYADLKKAIELNPHDDLYRENLRITENAIRNSSYYSLESAESFAEGTDERRKQALKKREKDRRIAEYTEAIQGNANDDSAYLSRGMIYEERKNYDQAIADYEMAVKLKPDNEEYRKQLAELKERARREAEQKEKAEKQHDGIIGGIIGAVIGCIAVFFISAIFNDGGMSIGGLSAGLIIGGIIGIFIGVEPDDKDSMEAARSQ
jgi:Flp pilus assembly protein TadD